MILLNANITGNSFEALSSSIEGSESTYNTEEHNKTIILKLVKKFKA
jgi:hypothetical protein